MRIPPDAARLLTPEFRLVAACSFLDQHAWPEQCKQIAAVLNESVDPAAFQLLVRRHRLSAIVYTALTRAAAETSLAIPFSADLQAASLKTRMRNLRLHMEWQRLQRLCLDAGIPVRTLKGTALSERLYGDIGLRHTRDIDLLVRPEDADKTLNVLRGAGYAADTTASAQSSLCRAIEYHTECRSAEGILVELHSHIERPLNSRLDTIWPELAWHADNAVQKRFELLYCCLHGCGHGWSRLKWLGDVRLMASRMTQEDWLPTIETASALQLNTSLAQMLLLLDWITGFSLPAPCVRMIEETGRSAEKLALQSLMWMGLPESSLGWTTMGDKWRHFRLDWTASSRWSVPDRAKYWIMQSLFSPSDLRKIQLPPWMACVYPVIRPLSFVGRHILGSSKQI